MLLKMNSTDPKNTRVIKKYNSRRLYDTTTSTYISFSDLGKIINDGFDVFIFDSKTKEDITQFTLARYLAENMHILNFCSDDLLRLIIKNQAHTSEQKIFVKNLMDHSLTYWASLNLKA